MGWRFGFEPDAAGSARRFVNNDCAEITNYSSFCVAVNTQRSLELRRMSDDSMRWRNTDHGCWLKSHYQDLFGQFVSGTANQDLATHRVSEGPCSLGSARFTAEGHFWAVNAFVGNSRAMVLRSLLLLHSSKLTWKWRGDLIKTTTVYMGPC